MDLHIKDFPEDLQRRIKSEAALTGVSLRELVINMLEIKLLHLRAKTEKIDKINYSPDLRANK